MWESFYEQFIVYDGYQLVLQGLKNTMIIALAGLVIGIFIGTLVAVIHVAGTRNKVARVFAYVGDVYTTIFRGTPIGIDVAKVVETYGKVDILVNNAGMIEMCPTVDLPLDKWQRVVGVSLTGYFLMARECSKQSMIPNKYGRIVNTASMFGHIASFHNPILVYNATKGAVPNFTRSLAQEWAEYNITVNAIGPGMFPSEMMVVDDATRDYLAARCPIGRPGVVDELCGQLLLFSSDACSYTTGQTIYIDGGWTCV